MKYADDRVLALQSIRRMADLLAAQKRVIRNMELLLNPEPEQPAPAPREPIPCRHCGSKTMQCRCYDEQQSDYQLEANRPKSLSGMNTL